MTAKTPRGQSGLDDRPASRRWPGEACRRPQWLQSWVVTEPEAVEAAQSQPGAIEIGEAAAFLCRERARCKVLHGGRGGLKSWSAARTLLLAGVDRTLRILCAREFQNSIADSVHRLLADQIGLMGLGNFYQVQNTTILGANGTEFIFVGLRYNVESINPWSESTSAGWRRPSGSVSGRGRFSFRPSARLARRFGSRSTRRRSLSWRRTRPDRQLALLEDRLHAR